MALAPIVRLSLAEAFAILRDRFGQADLPPLEALENEDWGRDYLLSRFLDIPPADLADAGLTVSADGDTAVD